MNRGRWGVSACVLLVGLAVVVCFGCGTADEEPQVVSVEPGADATDVPVTTGFVITFDRRLKGYDEVYLDLSCRKGPKVEDEAWEIDGKTLRITRETPLPPACRIGVGLMLEDPDNRKRNFTHHWYFTTAGSDDERPSSRRRSRPSTPTPEPETDASRARVTAKRVKEIGEAINWYAVDNAVFPPGDSFEEALSALTPRYISKLETEDGWGQPLLIAWDDAHSIVVSAGADGVFERNYDPSDELEYRGPVDDYDLDIIMKDASFYQHPSGTR